MPRKDTLDRSLSTESTRATEHPGMVAMMVAMMVARMVMVTLVRASGEPMEPMCRRQCGGANVATVQVKGQGAWCASRMWHAQTIGQNDRTQQSHRTIAQSNGTGVSDKGKVFVYSTTIKYKPSTIVGVIQIYLNLKMIG